jgi:acyl-coenzyme A thioesterase PaaI-like protein
VADQRLSHHELCFGCGQANLFGLQLELERRPDGGVGGRFFVKQDHQGPPGYAHGGVLATALDEAMSLLVWDESARLLTARLEVDLESPAPVGSFVEVTARVDAREERKVTLLAEAECDGARVAAARGIFVRV